MTFIPPPRKIIVPLYLPPALMSFQKLELTIYELNKSVDSELALLNKKNGFFF